MIYSEGSAPLKKSVALITSGSYKLIIHGWNKVAVEKLYMLIVILPALCGQVIRLLHDTTLDGHQFFLLCILVRTISGF